MSNKKTKINCHLITRGTSEADAQVVDDLTVPDPELAIGEQIIQEATNEDDNPSEHS
ncbi:unnamed protein product [marine sediment metagenome]|uniref:Uncharacterized protein n=1 Tax=marine sediment metagenome TaxID=412755 RepID=X1SU75_9ZZZZ